MLIRVPRQLDSTRRRLLVDMTIGGAAFALGACGEPARAQPLTPPEPADVGVLQSQVWMEDDAIAAYEAGAGLLSEGTLPVALAFLDHHKAHRQSAIEALAAVGLERAAPNEQPLELPDLEDEIDVLKLALGLETQASRAYIGLVAQTVDVERRRIAASILGCEMSHAIALRAALGAPPIQWADFAFGHEIVTPRALRLDGGYP